MTAAMDARWEKAARSEALRGILLKLRYNPETAADLMGSAFGLEILANLSSLILDEMTDRGLFLNSKVG